MRATRYTCWALITLLLMHGGGVFSTLHKLSHHTTRSGAVTQCDHHHNAGTQHSGNNERVPTPLPDDDQCSICLGLSGLHMGAAPMPTQVVLAPVFVENAGSEACTPILSREARIRSARAPPIC